MSPGEGPATVAPSRASLALAATEPLLPALGVLLDDRALSAWLSEHHGRRLWARRRYLRFKPGTSVVLAAEVDTASGPRPLLVTGYAPAGIRKLDKGVAKAAPHSVLAVDRDRRMLATDPRADRDLPSLAAIADPARRARVLGRLLGTDPGPGEVDVTVLSYKPQRRWVGAVGAGMPDPVLARAYRPDQLGDALRPLTALAAAGGPVPRVLGRHRRLGLALLEHVPGTPPDGAADLAATGRALARLHRTPAPLHPVDAPIAPGGVRETIHQVGRLLPGQSDRARALDVAVHARLAPHAPTSPTPPADGTVALHGDFALDQVVCHAGEARLIDLDRAGSGPAARDLGGLLAAELAGPAAGRPGLARERLDAVLAGYAETLPVPDETALVAHTLDRLLDRAAEPFRHALPDWAERIDALLGAAESLLSDGLPTLPRSTR